MDFGSTDRLHRLQTCCSPLQGDNWYGLSSAGVEAGRYDGG